jgi:hypothetical protein
MSCSFLGAWSFGLSAAALCTLTLFPQLNGRSPTTSFKKENMMATRKDNNAYVSFKANSTQDMFLHWCKYSGSVSSRKVCSKKK